MIFTKLSPKQLKSMLWWTQKDTHNYDAIVCDGSVRSGKIMSMSIGFILWSGRNFNCDEKEASVYIPQITTTFEEG